MRQEGTETHSLPEQKPKAQPLLEPVLVSFYLEHHSHFQRKITRQLKVKKKTQFEDREPVSEPDSDVAEVSNDQTGDFRQL